MFESSLYDGNQRATTYVVVDTGGGAPLFAGAQPLPIVRLSDVRGHGPESLFLRRIEQLLRKTRTNRNAKVRRYFLALATVLSRRPTGAGLLTDTGIEDDGPAASQSSTGLASDTVAIEVNRDVEPLMRQLASLAEELAQDTKAPTLDQVRDALNSGRFQADPDEVEVALTAARTRGDAAKVEILKDAKKMLSADAAADLIKTSRETINTWRKQNKLLALKGPTRGFRYPVRQFELQVYDGRLISFLEKVGDAWESFFALEQVYGAFGDQRSGWDLIVEGRSDHLYDYLYKS